MTERNGLAIVRQLLGMATESGGFELDPLLSALATRLALLDLQIDSSGNVTSGAAAFLSTNVYHLSSYATLTAALAAISTDTATLLVDNAATIATTDTVPSNVTLWFLAPGSFAIDSGKTTTIQGPVLAGRYQIFSGAGSVDLTDAQLDWVYPEWWGAVPLKAASGTPDDSTAAITAAISSTRNVLFDQGIYGTTGGHTSATDGQTLRGQGSMAVADGQGGTVLYRLSGTTTLLTLTGFVGQSVERIAFDGNSLGGVLLYLNATKYAAIRELRFRTVGGTSYALYTSGVNLCALDNLAFEDTNYGHILTNAASTSLYMSCTNLHLGQTTGGYGLDLQNCANWGFTDCYIEGPCRTGTNCRALRFVNLRAESSETATAYFALDSTLWGFSVEGGTFSQSSGTDASAAFFAVSGREIRFENLRMNDLYSSAGRPWFLVDNAFYSSWDTIGCYSSNAFDFIQCTGTVSGYLTLNNCASHSGTTGMCDWKATNITVTNCQMTHEIQDGTSNLYFFGSNGAITAPANNLA